MDEDFMETQDSVLNDVLTLNELGDIGESTKDTTESLGFDENYDGGDDDGSNSFRGGRGRGNFRGRGRGPLPGWMNGPPPPLRFRGRGYGPGGPPMRGRGFFRGRGGPRFGPNNGPGFEGNWGPPPGMMGGPPPYGPPPGMMPPGGPMGPPPNMGHPPPFAGGPPGMPPPNMPAPELWVETKTDTGKPYYYHSRTRETTWTRPLEGPTCKVITHSEMEIMVKNNSNPMQGMMGQKQMSGGNNMGGGPPISGASMGMMNGMMQGGMMPPGVAPGPAQGSGSQFNKQPPRWMKDGAGKDTKSPADNDDAPPGDTAPVNQPNGAGGYQGPWGNWGWPPPGVAPQASVPNASGAPAAVPDKGAATQIPVTQMGGFPGKAKEPGDSKVVLKKKETTIPPDLAARAAEWTTHNAPDGRPYYYNASKKESVWVKPRPLKLFEDLKAKIAAEKGESGITKSEKPPGLTDTKVEVIDVEAHAEAQATAAAAAEAALKTAEQEREREREREQAEKEKAEREKAEKEKAEREKAEKEKAKQDRSRPRWSTPISGTPWCVVWTGDGRVFFYNPTANSSVWERPPQLVGRADVDKVVSQPPIELQKEDGTASSATNTTKAATTTAANGDLKRTAETDTDDSEAEPAKKIKAEAGAGKKGGVGAGVIDAGKEAAAEAEIRAARERELLPFEQRVRSFLQMLHESEVSAFSPWEKELHKIVFDSRYLLLNSTERKQVFYKYVRERAEEERKEKKNRLQQKKNTFRQLMEEAKLHSKSSFTEFSSKHCRDERFKAIEKVRDREKYFNEYIVEVRKREKEEKDRKKEQSRSVHTNRQSFLSSVEVKNDFFTLLKEKSVGRHTRWIEIKKKIDAEARYKAVEGSALREDYFREYCKQLKDERKKDKDGKEKERERGGSKKEKKDKEREKDKEEKKEKDGKKEKKKEKAGDAEGAVEATGEAGAGAEAPGEGSPGVQARERELRAQASIKEREREVQRALATSLRDRDKEREYHKRDEAVQHFNALLADLVRNPDLNWREAKKQLKKDHRYKLAELLTKDDKERLFGQHTGALGGKRRDKLRALFAELSVSCTSKWREVRDRLQQHSAAPQYADATQMEREFRDYQRDKTSAAKASLRQLLMESRSISHRTFAQLKESPAAEQALHDSLAHDARYTALEHCAEERAACVLAYVEELHKKGPPPPPTASEPSRRTK